MHGSSAIWKGRFEKKTKSIEDVKDMMTFYGIKPYHMVLMKYEGGLILNFKFYNPYAIEINYPIQGHASPSNLVYNAIEVDKLASNFSFNAFGNFSGVHQFRIEQKHLLGCSFTEVIFYTYINKSIVI